MKLHPQLTEKVLYLCTNYGGHKDEKRLISHLENLRISIYSSEKVLVLVDTQTFVNERIARGMPTNDIFPMKLHGTVMQKLLYLYEMYSGHTNEVKFKKALNELDFTPYERKENSQDVVLVLTSDYMKTMQGAG